jgi:putative transposase
VAQPALGGLPKWQLVYYYFRWWQADDTLEKLNFALNCRERERLGKQDSPGLLCIDSQAVKVAPFVAAQTGRTATRRSRAVGGT